MDTFGIKKYFFNRFHKKSQKITKIMATNALKRPAENNSLVAIPQNVKRSRNDELVQTFKDKQLMEKHAVMRSSNLEAPIMKLEGHESDIFTCEFHPEGEYLGNKKYLF